MKFVQCLHMVFVIGKYTRTFGGGWFFCGGDFLLERGMFQGKTFLWGGRFPWMNFQRETLHRGIYQNSCKEFFKVVWGIFLWEWQFSAVEILYREILLRRKLSLRYWEGRISRENFPQREDFWHNFKDH